ncbi:MAG: M20/M25/M40 family metallo-hydrolase, partial [Chloroflexota bacterium]
MTDNAAPPSRDDEALERFLAGNADDRMRRYQELLRIPSISALPEHAGDCRATADWIVGELRRLGIDDAEASETGGHPIVTGSYRRDGHRPTALVYCHYDVQPVDPLDLWTSPPFEPAVHDGRVVARGAADDKGQIHIHLAALEALLATRSELPVNLRFVF